jgi:hypothetical protein
LTLSLSPWVAPQVPQRQRRRPHRVVLCHAVPGGGRAALLPLLASRPASTLPVHSGRQSCESNCEGLQWFANAHRYKGLYAMGEKANERRGAYGRTWRYVTFFFNFGFHLLMCLWYVRLPPLRR